MKQLVRNFVRSCGFDVIRYPPAEAADDFPSDITPEERSIFEQVRPFTKTGVERIMVLIRATMYIVESKIPGDIVECGVWRGGSMMAVALTLQARGDTSRDLYLYDTFEGMTEPTSEDKLVDGRSAKAICDETPKGTGTWSYASLEEVRNNLSSTGYPANRMKYIQGPVEETIPEQMPERVSLLRLDTDWYESTRHELHHLYPLLQKKGLLIIDDYGHWEGARRATDEYFRNSQEPVFLNRIDYTGRLLVKE